MVWTNNLLWYSLVRKKICMYNVFTYYIFLTYYVNLILSLDITSFIGYGLQNLKNVSLCTISLVIMISALHFLNGIFILKTKALP